MSARATAFIQRRTNLSFRLHLSSTSIPKNVLTAVLVSQSAPYLQSFPSRTFQTDGRLLPTPTPAGTWRGKANQAKSATQILINWVIGKLDSIKGNLTREPGVPVSHRAVTATSGHSGGSFHTVRLAACGSKPSSRTSSTELPVVRGMDPSESASTRRR